MKTSSKSTPVRCTYPFATKQALCLVMFPSASRLILNTHFRPMGFTPGGASVRVHILLLVIDLSSFDIARIHSLWSTASL